MRLIDADTLNRRNVNCANVPMNFIDTAPTVKAILTADMIDILEKIKVEIEGLTYYWCEVNPRSVIDDVLQIVDKYRKGVNV